ncbi:laccase [Russula dissimulans]|nr:laccase [Russula dissimulans]
MRLCSLAVILVALSGKVSRAFTIGPDASLTIYNNFIAPDGFFRPVSLADNIFPGPLIAGKKGDTFSIDVTNALTNRDLDLVTSIHWHGLFQHRTNYADGGAFVNQCPIVPSETFNYEFSAGAQTGTYWYHSHYQAQYCDGLRGPLVIYDPNDPHAHLYDVDNENTIITLADWYHYVSADAPPAPDFNSTLINGKGRYPGGPRLLAPLAVVDVIPLRRYRLRVVSISCDPAYTFSIDSHQLTIIEVDGINVQPLVVDSLQIFAGQRYSVVLNANQRIGNYWIRALPFGSFPPQNFAGTTNVAILHYLGAFLLDPTLDSNANVPQSILPLKETDLHPLVPDPLPGLPFPGGADINIVLNVELGRTKDNPPTFGFFVNNASFTSPNVPVLLQILNGANASNLLPKGSVYPLERSKSVEISIPALATNPGGPHPIHLHGHAFHVVRSAGNSTYNFDNPVVRDVVSIGTTGDNVTIRFFTDNPGPWFLHCHIDWHLEKGFAVVFAEDVPDVKTLDAPPDEWDELCGAYNNFVGATKKSE